MPVEIDRFVNWLRRRNPEARTWRDYRYDLKQFTAAVGDRPPGSVTFHDVDRFVSQQAARGFKPATITVAWPPSRPCTPSWPTRTPPWSVPSCRTGTACANPSACRDRFKKRSCGASSPSSRTPATGLCSRSC
jgi:hypothetical protein